LTEETSGCVRSGTSGTKCREEGSFMRALKTLAKSAKKKNFLQVWGSHSSRLSNMSQKGRGRGTEINAQRGGGHKKAKREEKAHLRATCTRRGYMK